MPSLPSRRKTDRALYDALRAAKATVKEANRDAGRLVTKGNYQAAEALVNLAKAATAFQSEISALRHRWREIGHGQSEVKKSKSMRTPLWEFYKPILATLQSLDGSATRLEIEKHIETTNPSFLKAGDLQLNTQGKARWTVMVRRARKPMMQEKFIEPGNSKKWVITGTGRKALVTDRKEPTTL